ncbi:hypothetical protein M2161_007455 [Streptomyces sp. SAI-133]|nr:hypothetical protein [Streptomyces sp. SAI-133]
MRHPPRSVLLAVAAPTCSVQHSVTGQRDSGFRASVRINDNSAGVRSCTGVGPTPTPDPTDPAQGTPP